MDNFESLNVTEAAVDVLQCTSFPFLLVIPCDGGITTYSRKSKIYYAGEKSASSVFCRQGSSAELEISFDGEPVPPPNGKFVLSGFCKNISADSILILDQTGAEYSIQIGGNLKRKFEIGGKFKLLVQVVPLKEQPALGKFWLGDENDIFSD